MVHRSSTITEERNTISPFFIHPSRFRLYTIHCMSREVVGLFLLTIDSGWHGWGAFLIRSAVHPICLCRIHKERLFQSQLVDLPTTLNYEFETLLILCPFVNYIIN